MVKSPDAIVPFPVSKSALAAALEIEEPKLNYLLYGMDAQARYHSFEIPKRGGGKPRQILAPIPPLREIQRRLLKLLTPFYVPSKAVSAFVANRGPLYNASQHCDKQVVLRVDMADFFPSINFGRVRGLFLNPPFNVSPHVATIVAQICCHNNSLPQGAPTSPFISNLILRTFDKQALSLARRLRCHYTRYCDDLVFSRRYLPFPTELAATDRDGDSTVHRVGEALEELIKASGFRVNSGKTRLMRFWQRQFVTGLVVNRHPSIKCEEMRSLRACLYVWRRHGEATAQRAYERRHQRILPPLRQAPSFALHLRGRVQHVGYVRGWDSKAYLRLARALAVVDPSFRPKQPKQMPAQIKLVVGGPSDRDHLVAAQRWFNDQGLFTGLAVDISVVEPGGDGELERSLRSESESQIPRQVLTVYLFDSDSDSIRKKFKPQRPNRVSSRLYSMALRVPQHRREYEGVCIELLFEDRDLERTNGGRRIYRTGEFDPRTKLHVSSRVFASTFKAKELITELVTDPVTRKNVALPKTEFARLVLARTPPFEQVSFGGFVSIFETLEDILRQERLEAM